MILNMDKIQFESRAEIGTIIKALEDWQQDISRLRLEVNYDDIKGKTFKTVCEYNDKKESGESETDQPLPRTGTEG